MVAERSVAVIAVDSRVPQQRRVHCLLRPESLHAEPLFVMVLDHRGEQLTASLGRLGSQFPSAEHLVGDLRASAVSDVAYVGEQARQATSYRHGLIGFRQPELHARCSRMKMRREPVEKAPSCI